MRRPDDDVTKRLASHALRLESVRVGKLMLEPSDCRLLGRKFHWLPTSNHGNYRLFGFA